MNAKKAMIKYISILSCIYFFASPNLFAKNINEAGYLYDLTKKKSSDTVYFSHNETPFGDTLYSEEQKAVYMNNLKNHKIDDQYLKTKTGKIYATATITIDHKWEAVGSKYRRHSFYKIRQIMKNDNSVTPIQGINK